MESSGNEEWREGKWEGYGIAFLFYVTKRRWKLEIVIANSNFARA